VPTQRNSRDENAELQAGRTPAGWKQKPAKLRQKDRDARWTSMAAASSATRSRTWSTSWSGIMPWPVAFFFEGASNASAPHGSHGSTLSMAEINDFTSDSDGLRLIRAFMRIDNAAVRRRIVMLVQEIAGDDGN
jgi:hypothetical protein